MGTISVIRRRNRVRVSRSERIFEISKLVRRGCDMIDFYGRLQYSASRSVRSPYRDRGRETPIGTGGKNVQRRKEVMIS